MKKIIVLLFLCLTLITAVGAVDSGDWETVTIKHHDFKIPSQYAGGDLSDGKYTYENWRIFQISVVDNSLPMVYGFANGDNAYVEDLDIDGHAVRYFNEYNNAEKANVSKVFFSVGQSVYMISWKGNEFSDDVKEIIATSDSSEFSSSEFYDILKEAMNQYNIQEQSNLNTPDPVYIKSDNHYNKNDDFIRYYLTYRLLQSSRR